MWRGEVGEDGGVVHIAEKQIEREEGDGDHDLKSKQYILYSTN